MQNETSRSQKTELDSITAVHRKKQNMRTNKKSHCPGAEEQRLPYIIPTRGSWITVRRRPRMTAPAPAIGKAKREIRREVTRKRRDLGRGNGVEKVSEWRRAPILSVHWRTQCFLFHEARDCFQN